MAKTEKKKTRKVKVLERDDSNISQIEYKETIYETDETAEELSAHAHVHSILEDPVKESGRSSSKSKSSKK